MELCVQPKSLIGMRRFIVLTIMLLLATACAKVHPDVPAVQPEDHAKFLDNEDYKKSFGEYAEIMAGLEKNLSSDEYAALEKKSGQEIADSVRQSLEEYGFPEMIAWSGAYAEQIDQLVDTVVVWEMLKRNPIGIQGYYRFKGGIPDGYLTVRAVEGCDYYDVAVRVGDGGFWGSGKLESGKMTAEHEYSGVFDDILDLSFDGDTARVMEVQGSNKGALDGAYLREKK